MKFLDLTGKVFSRLTAIRRVENHSGYGQARWLFLCECGRSKELFGYSVVHGKVKSCGCLKTETKSRLLHGRTGSPEFLSWVSMRQRCKNPRCKAYSDYGGRGIDICREWDVFETFLADMGPRPAGASLDRIDNDKGYSPQNCRWASKSQQINNRRLSILYEYDGVSRPLIEWALLAGVPYKTFWHRYKVGKRGSELLSSFIRGGGRPRTASSRLCDD